MKTIQKFSMLWTIIACVSFATSIMPAKKSENKTPLLPTSASDVKAGALGLSRAQRCVRCMKPTPKRIVSMADVAFFNVLNVLLQRFLPGGIAATFSTHATGESFARNIPGLPIQYTTRKAAIGKAVGSWALKVGAIMGLGYAGFQLDEYIWAATSHGWFIGLTNLAWLAALGVSADTFKKIKEYLDRADLSPDCRDNKDVEMKDMRRDDEEDRDGSGNGRDGTYVAPAAAASADPALAQVVA